MRFASNFEIPTCSASYGRSRMLKVCKRYCAPRNISMESSIQVVEFLKVILCGLGCERGRNFSFHLAYKSPRCPAKWAAPDGWTLKLNKAFKRSTEPVISKSIRHKERCRKYLVAASSDMMQERIGMSMRKRSNERLKNSEIQTCFYTRGGVGKRMWFTMNLHNSVKVTYTPCFC